MYTIQELNEARKLLEVDENTSLVDIKKAYRKQALKYHPDKNKNDSNAKERMQALNNAHDLLQNSDNGKKQVSETDSSFTYADLYQFYEFFDRNWTSSSDDKISESEFQNILNEVEENITEHDGLVYPGYEKLKGVSAAQIKRLVEHCEDYNGTRFRLSGQRFRPEVLVALLTCLTHYRLDSNERCELDLSEIDINHPEVIVALSIFAEAAKSQWKVILNKTHLAMDDELAKSFASSKSIYELSLEKNHLKANHVLSIVQNQTIESLELQENYLSAFDLAHLALTTIDNASLSKVSLSIANRGTDKHAGYVLNAFLQNKGGLKSIAIHSLMNSTLSVKKTALLINPFIESLTLKKIDIGCHTIQRLLSHALPNLKRLFIYECDLSDKVLKAIAEGLKKAKHIESVFIEGTRGLHEGQAAILDAVRNHPTLKELIFYYFSFGEYKVPLEYQIPKAAVTDALQRLFKENKILQQLNLDACNVFSEKASKALTKTFEKHNKSIIKMDLRKILPNSSDTNISYLVNKNHGAWLTIHSEPKKAKKEKVIRFSREALQHRINIVEDLIAAKVSTLSLQPHPKPKYRQEEPRLSTYNDKYISVGQLHQWLDVVLKGQFTGVDLSNEYDLPPLHQGVILERLTQHYQSNSDVNSLHSLDLSHNNLTGQVDKLIALLDVCQQLSELKLAHVKFKPGEITKLVQALAKHSQLKELALCAQPEISYKKSDQTLMEQDVKQLAEFVSNSQTLKYFSLTQGQHDFNSERMDTILEGLPKNIYLQKLVLELNTGGAEDKLIQLVQKAQFNQLTLKFEHGWMYGGAIKAALSSHQLTHLAISNYQIGGVISLDEAFNQKGDSTLTHLTLKSCDVDTATLRSIKLLPLIDLDLSNNRLYADKEGESLIELVEAQAKTLERLNLTGHSLYSTHSHSSDNTPASVFLAKFAEALSKCKKLKSLMFGGGEREFDVHALAKFIHSIRRYNPSLVIDISLPHNAMNDKLHMFNETSQYLKFVLQDIRQQQDLKSGLILQSWQVISQRYECEIARLLTELTAALKEKRNPSRFSFFRAYKNTGPLKWEVMHQTLLEALEKKEYATFHNKWQKWEKAHSPDETDINIGVYFGFIDECLLLYAHAIRQSQQKSYDWVEAYPDVPVLENNYCNRLTELQHDQDEKRRAFEAEWKQERVVREKKEKEEMELSQKIKKGDITDPSQIVSLSEESNLDQKVLTYI